MSPIEVITKRHPLQHSFTSSNKSVQILTADILRQKILRLEGPRSPIRTTGNHVNLNNLTLIK